MKLKNTLILGYSLFIYACGGSSEEQESTAEESSEEAVDTLSLSETVEEENVDYTTVVADLDTKRATIESELENFEQKELSTDEMREQIKQKWSKVHYYLQDGKIVRIKTYPYEKVSTRTEEFYLEDGVLFLAVIEDEGAGKKGHDENFVGKSYYFQNDAVIHETNSTGEAEQSIRTSDAERLLQEAKEYVAYFERNQ